MNFRLKIAELIILMSQNTFSVRGRIRNFIWRSIEKIINYDTQTDPKTSRIKTKVDGVSFYIYFDYRSDVKIAFGNYNKKEINFIKQCMTSNSTFIDIGSNIGIYTINVASIYPKTDFFKILSIEANPLMIKRQKENVELLNKERKGVKDKIILEECAVSNIEGNLQLDLESGYGSASISENKTNDCISVKANTLMNILIKNKINKITCLKIDIEGHEDKALIPFFKSAQRSLYPQNIVMEFSSQQEWTEEPNLIGLLSKIGYKIQLKTRGNICFKLEH